MYLELTGVRKMYDEDNGVKQIDLAVESCRPENLILDFGEVTFMDSSGIGLVMGRYQVMKNIGGRVSLQNTPVHIRKVMRLAGLDRFATIN